MLKKSQGIFSLFSLFFLFSSELISIRLCLYLFTKTAFYQSHQGLHITKSYHFSVLILLTSQYIVHLTKHFILLILKHFIYGPSYLVPHWKDLYPPSSLDTAVLQCLWPLFFHTRLTPAYLLQPQALHVIYVLQIPIFLHLSLSPELQIYLFSCQLTSLLHYAQEGSQKCVQPNPKQSLSNFPYHIKDTP